MPFRFLSILLFACFVCSSAVADETLTSDKPATRSSYSPATVVGVVVEKLGTKNREGLLVRSVLNASPAEKAGLLTGDIILKIEGQSAVVPFEDAVNSLIETARKAGKNSVNILLQCERENTQKKIAINVTLRELDLAVAVTKALDYLADELAKDPNYKKTPQRSFYAPIIYAPLAGLAFLENGSTRLKGRHAKALRNILAYVMLHGGKRKENQDAINKAVRANICSLTHNSGFSAMFLAQLIDSEKNVTDQMQHAAKLKFSRQQILDKLRACCRSLETLQIKNGGWQHGSGGANALGYTHLMAATITAMNGLAMAQQVGVKVDRTVLDKGLAYIRKSTTAGHVGYALGNRGSFSAGRNAGVLQILYRLGLKNDKLVKPVMSKLVNNLRGAETGHGSPVWHLFYSGIAVAQLSSDARQEFDVLFRKKLLRGQQADGSILAPGKPGTQPETSEENRVWGPLYTTPLIVLALQAQDRQGMLIYNFLKVEQ